MIELLKKLFKKVEDMNEVEMATHGIFSGERCNRGSCTGIIEKEDGSCYCSASSNPPCSYCESGKYYCPECDWEA